MAREIVIASGVNSFWTDKYSYGDVRHEWEIYFTNYSYTNNTADLHINITTIWRGDENATGAYLLKQQTVGEEAAYGCLVDFSLHAGTEQVYELGRKEMLTTSDKALIQATRSEIPGVGLYEYTAQLDLNVATIDFTECSSSATYKISCSVTSGTAFTDSPAPGAQNSYFIDPKRPPAAGLLEIDAKFLPKQLFAGGVEIYNGESFDSYNAYIWNADENKWDLYAPYLWTGTSWELY